MSEPIFQFNNLPFEIIWSVIGLLEHCDVYSVCLVSRTLDEIASPILYKTVRWTRFLPIESPPGGPCLAFQRRPFLRNYVRTIEFDHRGNYHKSIQMEHMLVIGKELRLLPALEVVRWWRWGGIYAILFENASRLFIPAMANIPNLKEIRLPHIPPPQHDLLDALNQQLSIVSFIVDKPSPGWRQWLERHRHGLRELNIISVFAINCDINFDNLQKLSLTRLILAHVSRFVAMMKSMPNLQELAVYCILQDLELREPHEYAKIVKLRSLKIHLTPMGGPLFDSIHHPMNTLKYHKYIASNSRYLCGEMLISAITDIHAASIHTLWLDCIIVTKDALSQLFTRCTHLQELRIKMVSHELTLVELTTMGPLAATLRHLYLTTEPADEPEDLEVERFLTEAMPTLTRLNIYTVEDARFGEGNAQCVIWEHHWVYNRALNSPQHKITKKPAVIVSWKNK